MERRETAAMVARRLYNRRASKLKTPNSSPSVNSPKNSAHASPLAIINSENQVKTPLRNVNQDQNATNNARAKFNRQLNEIKKELNSEKMKIDELEYDLSTKHKENQLLKNKIEILKKKLHEVTAKLDSSIDLDSYQDLKKQFENELKASKALTDEIKVVQNRSKDLEDEIFSLIEEKSKLNERIDEMFDDNKKLASQLVELKMEQTKLQEDLQQCGKKCETLISENEKLKETINKIEEQEKSLSCDGSFVNNILSTPKQEVQAEPLSLFTEMMLKEQVEKNEQLQDDFEQMRNDLNNLKETSEAKKKFIEELQWEKASLLKQLEHNKKLLNDSYRDLKIFVNKQMAEKQRTADTAKMYQETLARNKLNEESLREDCERWKKQYLELKEKSRSFEDKIREAEESWKAEKQIKEQYMKQNIMLESRIRALELQKQKPSPEPKRKVPPRGTGSKLFMADEEGQFMDARNITDIKKKPVDPLEDPITRLSILQTRNSHFPPHLKSSYPIETQSSNIEEKVIKGFQASKNEKQPPTLSSAPATRAAGVRSVNVKTANVVKPKPSQFASYIRAQRTQNKK